MPNLQTADQSTATARIVGPIDLEHSERTRRMLLNCLASRENVLVDMSAVTQIDGAGAVSLVEVHYAALKNGKGFALFCVGDQVMKVFRLARLDRVVTILDCPPEAPVH